MLMEALLVALAVLIGYPLVIAIAAVISVLLDEIPNDPDAP